MVSKPIKTDHCENNRFLCAICNVSYNKKYNLDRHLSTIKHMIQKDTVNSEKRVVGGGALGGGAGEGAGGGAVGGGAVGGGAVGGGAVGGGAVGGGGVGGGGGAVGGAVGQDGIFSCATCNFTCASKCNYIRHTNTKKHKTLQDPVVNKKKYDCQCGAKYKYSSGYYRHVKVCKHKSITQDLPSNRDGISDNTEECEVTPTMLKVLFETFIRTNQETIQSNRELKEAILEMSKNQAPHHNTNSHNKNINLVLFLNENYKDAMNLTDFVNNLQISFDDLEKMTEVGYIEAVSEKFISGLKQLDMKHRPIHFTDKARETLYARENNTWEKDENHKKITSSIHTMGRKYGSELQDYQATHPETKTLSTKEGEFAYKATKQLISSATNTKKVEKVIQNIVPNAFVERSALFDSR